MTTDAPQISEREREILRLVAKGATNQQIAQELNISINTVKVHLRNIFGKIGAASRTEATVFAIRQGLLVVDGISPQAEPEDIAPLADVPVVLAPQSEPLEPGDPLVSEHVVEPLLPVQEAALDTVSAPAPAAVEIPQPPAMLFRRLAPALIVMAVLGLVVAVTAGYLLRNSPAGPTATPTTVGTAVQQRWTAHASLPEPRSEFALAAYENSLFAISGARGGTLDGTVLRYETNQDSWQVVGQKPTPVRNARAVSIGGRIYVPGGEGADGKPIAGGEVFDPRSGAWEQLPALPGPRSSYAIASVEGTLYVIGGWDGQRYCDEVFALSPGDTAWATLEPLPTPRRNPSAAVLNNNIYVIGGEDQSGPLRTNERFQPFEGPNGSWQRAEPLPGPVATPAAVGLYTTLSVVDPEQATIHLYTPTSESWTTKSFGDVPFSSAATGIGTSIFLLGQPDTASNSVPLNEFQGVYPTFLPGISN